MSIRIRAAAAVAVSGLALGLVAPPAGAAGARLARSAWHVDVRGAATAVVDVRDAFSIDQDSVTYGLLSGGYLVVTIVNTANPALAAYVLGAPRYRYAYGAAAHAIGTVAEPAGTLLPRGRYRVTAYSDGAGVVDFTTSGLGGRISVAPRTPAPKPLVAKVGALDDPTGPSPGRMIGAFTGGAKTFAFAAAYASPPAFPTHGLLPLPILTGYNTADVLAACVRPAATPACSPSDTTTRAVVTPWDIIVNGGANGEAWIGRFAPPGSVASGAAAVEADVLGLTAISDAATTAGANAFTGSPYGFVFAAERQS